MPRGKESRRGVMHEVGMSFSYELSDWLFRKGLRNSLRENFYAVVGAASDAEDLASQVSTEGQDGTRSSNLVTDCLLSKKFFKEDFSLRGIDPRRIGFEERRLRWRFNRGQTKITSSFSSRRIFCCQQIWRLRISWLLNLWIFWQRTCLPLFLISGLEQGHLRMAHRHRRHHLLGMRHHHYRRFR